MQVFINLNVQNPAHDETSKVTSTWGKRPYAGKTAICLNFHNNQYWRKFFGLNFYLACIYTIYIKILNPTGFITEKWHMAVSPTKGRFTPSYVMLIFQKFWSSYAYKLYAYKKRCTSVLQGGFSKHLLELIYFVPCSKQNFDRK